MIGLLGLCPPAFVNADTVTLNSGEVLDGRIVSETDDQLMMEVMLYGGTILTQREVAKADIKSITRESLAEKQQKAAYAALAKYTLNPDQELTTNQYAAGITAFQGFLVKYPASSSAGDITNHLAEWRVEVSNVETGKVKFAGKWMTPEEKKVQVEQAQRQADAKVLENAQHTLKKQLVDLQAQRAALAESTTAIQAKLTAAQTKLAALKDAPGSSGGTAVGADRPGLAGQLTQKIKAPSQAEPDNKGVPNPERAQLESEIASYQQQISQGQTTISSLDAKIQELHSQVPKLEQDSKLAEERAGESAAGGKTNSTKEAARKDTQQSAAPKPEPPGPWYSRAWKWVSSFWH